MAIIDITVQATKDLGVNVCLFTLHPQHSKTYSHLLDLYTVAGPKVDLSVAGAPAVLMRGDMEQVFPRWAETLTSLRKRIPVSG